MPGMKPILLKTLGTMLALSAVLAVFTAGTAFAAGAYPVKPVRLILPQPPGGGTDVVARVIAAKLTERLGKQVLVDNRPGGGTIVGTNLVAKSEPDGYTLLFTTVSYATTAAVQKLPYDTVKSFAPIAKVGEAVYTLVVHPGVPAKSLKEFIALAKQKPGKLIFAGQGAGTAVGMTIELFKTIADIDAMVVQFKGAGPSVIDLLGGHSQALVGSVTQNLPYIKSGKFRALSVFGAKRSSLLPEVPTSGESGLSGCEAGAWWGMMAPTGTPVPVIDRLDKEIKAILNSDEIRKHFLDGGTEVDYQGPREFGAYIKSEIIKWTGVARKANIKVD